MGYILSKKSSIIGNPNFVAPILPPLMKTTLAQGIQISPPLGDIVPVDRLESLEAKKPSNIPQQTNPIFSLSIP